jgi:hypothetical protein
MQLQSVANGVSVLKIEELIEDSLACIQNKLADMLVKLILIDELAINITE